jgi:hypothetical protein
MELRAVLGEEWGSALPRTATGEAAVTRERTQDNVAAALSASLEPDRVFGVLETAPGDRLQHLPDRIELVAAGQFISNRPGRSAACVAPVRC